MRILAFATVALGGGAAFADPTAAQAPIAPPAAPAVSQTAAARPAAPQGLAIGAELGDPISGTVGWFTGKLAFVGGVGTGTFTGPGFHVHAGIQREVLRLGASLPLRIGGGARVYHHGYHEASVDEIPDTHVGLRATATLALERGPLQLYVEVAPGIDVWKSSSCNLASGARSVCPHAMESPAFFQMAIGARYFLAR